MITFLEGVLVERQPARIVVSCGGIGYDVAIPLSTFDRLPPEGQTCRVLTRLIVREDAHLLFGFSSREERALFDLLLAVTRVGPKLALAILSGLSVPQIRRAIAFQDSGMLASISGVGKKTAERIVVELKDKIERGFSDDGWLPAKGGPGGVLDEAAAALVALGYTRGEAQEAVARAMKQNGTGAATTEDVLRQVLSSIVG
jgi:Holliday junction DNA helicase RuvA